MNRLIRSLFIAAGLAGTLSACATYDYGYSYSPPYDYGYDSAPYAYDYGYRYDDPYYGNAPGYYVNPPAVGFDFRYGDRDHRDGEHFERDRDHRDGEHFDRDHRGAWDGDHRASSNGGAEREQRGARGEESHGEQRG